ncbi:MAG: TetR/AcrR family transcriptional regulator C-terminal domain-containing protein [Bryobacteraceae bacterium]
MSIKTTLAKKPAVKGSASRGGLIWERIGEPPETSPHAINTNSIVRIAMRLADTEGLRAVSMRRIASELGSGVMSLYHYVPCKDDLMDLLLDDAFGEIELPEQTSGDWRADLRLVAFETRKCLKTHSWLSALLSTRPTFGPHRYAQLEWALSAVSRLGLDIEVMWGAIRSLYIYIVGFVGREMSEGLAIRRARFDSDSAPFVRKLIATGKFPNVASYLSATRLCPPDDDTFNDGLNLVLEGIAAAVRKAEERK